MKVSVIVLSVALIFGGMMVVGALVPEIDPAPTAQAHVCDGHDYPCLVECIVHDLLNPGHPCGID